MNGHPGTRTIAGNSGIRSLKEDRSELPTQDSADYIIIGTGAGGATAGRVLSEAGNEVIFVEEGRENLVEHRPHDAWSAFREYWRDGSLQVSSARGKGFFPIIQGCGVGGTTTINGAIIHRLPKSIHHQWMQDVGLDEGILGFGKLHAIFDQLDHELFVGAPPEEMLGENNTKFREAAEQLGIDSNPVQRCVRGCKGSARCNQGCPNRAKMSMEQTFIPRAVRAGARVYATCQARSVGSENGTRFNYVRAQFKDPVSGKTGHHIDLFARKGVILAAGAVHTPWLLARSGVKTPSRLEGKRFQGHPGTSMLAEFPEPVNMWFGATQAYESTHYWEERMKFEVVGVPPAVAASRLPGIGSDFRSLVDRLPYMAHWGVQIRAHAMGRIRRSLLGGPSITYGLESRDVQLLKLGLKRLARMCFAAGAIRVFPGVHGLPSTITHVEQMDAIDDLPNDPRIIHGICAHLFGTAGFSSDAHGGVVDSQGQVWGHPGLYIMDASVLPTNMGVNPQHTISAISWAMAESIV